MTPITADDVVRFLEEHPRFFLDHPGLLHTSGLLDERSTSAKVLSLRERLFEQLKDERADLLRILDETIEVVRENEQIERDFLALEEMLFEERPSLEGLARIAEEIESRFGLDHAGFALLGGDGAAPAGGGPRLRRLSESERTLLPQEEGVVLKNNLDEGDALFPDDRRPHIHSCALVPLHWGGRFLGHLLLGSRNPERYRAGMATHLLERLAARLALGLSLIPRHAPPA